MRSLLFRNLIFWGSFLSWICAYAQVYNITRYSTGDGLVQSQVQAMLQDRFGYLWLGTHRGMSRFDGRNFTNFTTEGDSLRGVFVNALFEDEQGRIWIGTDQGISIFEKGRFAPQLLDDAPPAFQVACLTGDKKGNILAGTSKIGVLEFRGDSVRVDPYPWAGRASPPDIKVLHCSPQGNLFAGTNAGIFRLSDGMRWEPLPFEQPLIQTEILQIQVEEDGRIWFATPQGLFSALGNQLRSEFGQATDQPVSVSAFARDHRGTLWLGTEKGIFRKEGQQWIPLLPGGRRIGYRITAALVDNEGNLWFGSDGGGILKLVRGVFETYGIEQGLSSNLAKSFLEDDRGRIWISTYDQGINIWENGQVIRQIDQSNGLGGKDIVYSYKDSEGNFWFCTLENGLTRYDGQYFKVFRREDGLLSNVVYSILEVAPGRYWVGTDLGITILENGRVAGQITQEDGLPSRAIFTMRMSKDGSVWIGMAQGLVRFDGELFAGINPELIGGNVIAMHEDRNGRLWIGSSSGLGYWQNDQYRSVRVSGAPGASTIVSLVEDEDQGLWIGTENGLYRMDLKSFAPDKNLRGIYEHYTQKDGLPSLECNANAILVDRRGSLWVGTTEGAIRRPVGILELQEEMSPRIYITQVITGRDQPWESQGYETNDLGLPLDLKLPHTTDRIDFEYIGISLKSPRQVEYRFRLDGVDSDWQRPTRQTRVPYPNLAPGNYTFRVVAKMEAEAWDYEDPATFSFIIRPPFWQTWWFILLASISVVIIGWSIYRSATLRRRRQREARRIQNTADKLQLEHQALYAMMNPHFTFNALQSIQYFIHAQDKKSANKFLSSFARLVRKNLESTKSEFISVDEELERLELYLSLEKMRFPEKFDYQIEVDPAIDRHATMLPPMILQPFVENSIKHGIAPLNSGGKIEVKIVPGNGDHLLISIRDNGVGLAASQRRRQNRPSDHVSKGMQITKDRLALFARMSGSDHELKIQELTDSDGTVSGTEVRIKLPRQLEGEL